MSFELLTLSFDPGSRKPRPLAGMSPHSGVSQVPRALPLGLHINKAQPRLTSNLRIVR